MSFFGSVWSFLADYVFVIVVVGAIGVYAFIKIRKNKQSKRPTKIVTPTTNLVNKQPEAFASFRPDRQKIMPDKEENVLARIGNITDQMEQDSVSLEKQNSEDFENLRKQLVIVNERKEQIRSHGMRLADLHDKYKEREYHLTYVMSTMENFINHTKPRQK